MAKRKKMTLKKKKELSAMNPEDRAKLIRNHEEKTRKKKARALDEEIGEDSGGVAGGFCICKGSDAAKRVLVGYLNTVRINHRLQGEDND